MPNTPKGWPPAPPPIGAAPNDCPAIPCCGCGCGWEADINEKVPPAGCCCKEGKLATLPCMESWDENAGEPDGAGDGLLNTGPVADLMLPLGAEAAKEKPEELAEADHDGWVWGGGGTAPLMERNGFTPQTKGWVPQNNVPDATRGRHYGLLRHQTKLCIIVVERCFTGVVCSRESEIGRWPLLADGGRGGRPGCGAPRGPGVH